MQMPSFSSALLLLNLDPRPTTDHQNNEESFRSFTDDKNTVQSDHLNNCCQNKLNRYFMYSLITSL